MTPKLDGRLIAAIRELEAVFTDLQISAVFIGGVAVSLLANPRATEDIDALIVFDIEDRNALLTGLEARGFKKPFADMDDFVIQARLVTVIHESTGTVVDIMLGCMPLEEEIVARSQVVQESDIMLRLPTPEDLVILKAIASRPKDLVDIQSIAAVYPNLDRARVKLWIEAYAELLEAPELWAATEKLLTGQPR